MEALAALAELSLVKHDPFEDGAPAVTVHRLVQAVARARSGERHGAGRVERLIARLAAVYPDDGYSNPPHGRSARSSRHMSRGCETDS